MNDLDIAYGKTGL